MAGVEAEPQPLVLPECVEDHGQLVDGTADRAARARGVLHQQPGPVVAALQHLLERRDDALQARLEPGAQVGADVEDDALGVDRARRVHRRAHRVDALLVDRLVGRRQVDQVEAVDERGYPRLLAPFAEAFEVLRIVIRKPPGTWALHEQLHDVRVHPDRVVERLLDSAGTMGAEEHGSNLTACPSAFAWRRRRLGFSTSGTSARRSSTGCLRATTAASSVCASRTPTRAGRWRRRPSRSRSRCAGSGSTGTGTSPSSSTAWATAPSSHAVLSTTARPTKTRAPSASACPTKA